MYVAELFVIYVIHVKRVYLAHEQIEFYILHVTNMAVPEATLPSVMEICHAYFNNCNTPV